MQRFFASLALALGALLLPGAALAQDYPTSRAIATESWVEEWDPASQRWVRVSDAPSDALATGQVSSITTTHIVNGVVVDQSETALPTPGSTISNTRFATPVARSQPGQGIAQYGPFRVLNGARAALVGSTDQMSPAWFDAMMRDHPGLEVLEMIEAPGTRHDIANLKVGRKIRAAGLRTHVPQGGSVRSGAVELFLAGTERTMADGAEFAVHSWLDTYGRQPQDFPEDHPANRLYLDYYVEMGMSERQARDFYAMTNSVPHASALWLGADEMRPWVRARRDPVPARRTLMMASATPAVTFTDDGPLTFGAPSPPAVIALAPVAVPSIDYADLIDVAVARPDIALLDSRRAFP